ncbi:MAG: TolC family protein [Holophagaceae bacterium]|nr:TolC family protein [Holophagaceae bacterium]
MRIPSRLALVAILPFMAAAEARSQAQPISVPSSLAEDPVLQALLREAVEKSPQLAAATRAAEAEEERIPQAGSLPDPMLSLGYQNDGFKRFEIGRMETTFGTIMASQAFPFPGKRKLRTDIVSANAEAARASVERIRLTLEADLRRAYLGLLLARGQQALQKEQELIWKQAEAVAQARYEAGQGSQLDLLRAQLERMKAAQQALRLESEARAKVIELDRLAGRPLDSPIETMASLEGMRPPTVPARDAAVRQAEERSPELHSSHHHILHAASRVELAKLDLRPDFALSAGIMPRGALEPMWQVGFSVSIPLYSRTKQRRAIAENEALQRSEESNRDDQRRRLAQATEQRVAALEASSRILGLYASVLVQSRAAFESALAQFETGRAPFSSVLEVLNGYIQDRAAFLKELADAQGLAIALDEANPSTAPGIGNSMPVSGRVASAAPSM